MRNNLLTNVRNKFSELSLGEKQAHIKMLLNIPDTLPTLEYKATEAYSEKGMQVHEFIFQRKNEFPLSATLIYDLERYTDQDVFIILCSDSSFFNQKKKKIKQLLQKGYAVLLGEIRGCGNLADNPLSNNKKFYNDNYRTSALSLILGRPLVGQQVIDIYSYVDFANRHPLLQQAKIHCVSWGSVGLAAKHAKLLDARIASLQAEHLLHSFDKIIANPIQKNQLDLIVPNILKYYDISSLNQ